MRILLVGAGHTHMLLLRSLMRKPTSGIQWIFINPSKFFFYSGAFTAVLSGEQPLSFAQVDLEAFLKKSPGKSLDIQFLHDRSLGIDTDSKLVNLEHSGPVSYDFVSFNIGGESSRPDLFSIKPLARLEHRLKHEKFRRIQIVGGGAAGVEVALCLAHRFRNSETQIQLIERSAELLKNSPSSLADRAHRLLVERKVEVLLETNDQKIEADLKLAATGHQVQNWLIPSNLVIRKNYLELNSFLQTSQPEVFACGEGTQNFEDPWPQNGVTAVRQAPVLLQNLLSASKGNSPTSAFVSQKSFLMLLNCGDGTALGSKGNFSLGHNRANLWLKNFIDRRFLNQFRSGPISLDEL